MQDLASLLRGTRLRGGNGGEDRDKEGEAERIMKRGRWER